MYEQEINKFQLRLKEMRVKKKLTQKQLAEEIRIDHGYISKLESGDRQNPSLKILLRFCRFYKCTLSDLVGY